MADDEKKPAAGPAGAGGRKPYAKPSVTSEPIYETLALACGKLPGDGGVCNAAARRS